jgi:hypothetical protein
MPNEFLQFLRFLRAKTDAKIKGQKHRKHGGFCTLFIGGRK